MNSSHRAPEATDRRRGFTLTEVMVAATLSLIVLAGVLSANLQVIRGGMRIGQYVEMETQVRRALDTLGRDLKSASAIKWNSASDITLTIPAGNGSTSQVTYAWTSASETFFRVAGASSATVVGRLELIRGIPTQAGGAAGVTFARYDRDGVAATTDAATKSIQITLRARRSARTAVDTTETVSATFALRSKT
jgi:prepilin-type N-terminal cleavage/methylation domain-containing protein